MSEITVVTNNVPREITYGYELSEDERKEFDYLDWSEDDAQNRDFVRYKGELLDLGDFMRVPNIGPYEWMADWDGYISDTFFSGILVKYIDDMEHVIVGRFYG